MWKASPEGKRVIKTHFRWEDVPYSPEAKYIIVIRDPKDVFVSSYHFFVKDGPFSFTNLSVASWLEIFLSDRFVMGGSWGVATAAYWAQRDKPNVLICSFKEMRRDLEGSVRRVAAFLGVDASPEIIRRVTELSSFDYMKRIDDKFSTGKFLALREPAAMMRKGSEGGSSELLTPEQARRIDEYFIAELKRLGSDFPYAEFCRLSPGVSTGRAGRTGDGERLRSDNMRARRQVSSRSSRSMAAAPAFAQAPSGEAVYKQNCAACHEGTLPRMPTRAALREMTPEHVETALSSFSMRRQGASLTSAERRAVAEFVTGRPSGSYRAPLDVIPQSAYCAPDAGGRTPLTGASWNGWGVDARNTRFQPAAAAGLGAADVPKLKLKWAFGVPGVSASGSQVSVVGSRLFVGTPQRHRLLARREDRLPGVGVRGRGGRAFDAAGRRRRRCRRQRLLR